MMCFSRDTFALDPIRWSAFIFSFSGMVRYFVCFLWSWCPWIWNTVIFGGKHSLSFQTVSWSLVLYYSLKWLVLVARVLICERLRGCRSSILFLIWILACKSRSILEWLRRLIVPHISARCECIWYMLPKSEFVPKMSSFPDMSAIIQAPPDTFLDFLPSKATISLCFIWIASAKLISKLNSL